MSKLNLSNLQLAKVDKMREAAKTTFPIVSSIKALESDLYFKKGYDLHVELLQYMMEGKPIDDRFEECIECYEKSMSSFGTPEAIANMLWWLFVGGCQITHDRISEGVELLANNKISETDFLKKHWLQDCDEDLNEDQQDEIDEERKAFLEESEELIIELISELKRTEYSPLAEYYTALRFMFGLINNNKSVARNKAVGEELMLELVQTENKYAIEYLRISKP